MASKEMRYGMLGDDNASMKEKLAKYSGKVGWDYLKEHFQNGVLFFVDEELTLEEVGAAISEDETAKVTTWLKLADLVKIEKLHAIQWENKEQQFEALVVSPFVLCRPVS
jgi:hypothetical protein